MKTNLRFFRYLAFSLEIILLWVLQSTPRLMPELFGSKPLLLVAAALSMAAVEDVVPSLVFGAVCGAATDLSASGGIGFFSIALTLMCFGISRLLRVRFRANLVTLMVLSFGAVLLITGVYFLLFRLLAGVPGSGVLFVRHYFSRMGYTYVCVAPLYFLNLFLVKNLK